jgi:hypothetical protein
VIAHELKKCITKASLLRKQVVVCGADNCSIKYGKKPIFVKLNNSFNSHNLIAGYYTMHILHNDAKHRLQLLPFDVELLVIKMFNEFSSSGKKLEELNEFLSRN